MNTDLTKLSIAELAAIVGRDWSKVSYAASPYLSAMFSLESINDPYMFDSGQSVVLRFLGNAGSWRGETARAVKAELRRRLK